jgi:hypothetical protein
VIFAEVTDHPNVEKMLKVLVEVFGEVEWGDQGTKESPDAYFWIKRRGVKVAVDNLTSFEFQVKCAQVDTPLIQEVIDVLAAAFPVKVYDVPEDEGHE